MYGAIKEHLQKEIAEIKEAGLYKSERIITSSQDAVIKISTGEEVLNFCANNYLGLSNHPEVIQAAKDTMDTHGFGVSSVRFICGTQDIHKDLESKIAEFYQTEDTILYAAAFDANGGVFEPLSQSLLGFLCMLTQIKTYSLESSTVKISLEYSQILKPAYSSRKAKA